MSKKTIFGDIVVFENPYTKQDIILKHESTDYRLIFNSDVIFKKSQNTISVNIGNFEVTLSDDSNSLVIKKNGVTKFSVS